jgi:hypothetical protein
VRFLINFEYLYSFIEIEKNCAKKIRGPAAFAPKQRFSPVYYEVQQLSPNRCSVKALFQIICDLGKAGQKYDFGKNWRVS